MKADETYMKNLKIGDIVSVECFSGLGSGGKDKITRITTKYDEDTGEPYAVYWCGRHGFDVSGEAINEPYAYYIAKG